MEPNALFSMENLGKDLPASFDRTNLIAMTARVGSTAFVSGLESVGLFGRPIREIFNPRYAMRDLMARFRPRTLMDYLNAYMGEAEGRTLVFKTNWIDFAPAIRAAGRDFETFFPRTRIVYIERRDKVAQAYSLWKATEYNVWHRHNGTAYVNPIDQQVPLEPIRRNLRNLTAEETAWRRFFEARGLEPLVVSFEDIAQDFERTVSQAYQHFSGTRPSSSPRSDLVRSSDQKDAEIVADLRSRLGEKMPA